MITPNKKLFYAVEAVLYIAYHAGKSPITSRVIARQQDLPSRYLEQIMQRLVHGKILRSVRGPRGGYLLAKEREEITLADICNLVEDEDQIDKLPPTTPLGDEVLRPYWKMLAETQQEQLAQMTLAELYNQAKSRQI